MAEEPEDEPNPFPDDDGGGCFGLRGMAIDDCGWEEFALLPGLRRGIEPSKEGFFFGILQEFDPLPSFF